MKNLIIILSLAGLAFSCSNKITLVKRKYNKGFYVSTGTGKSKEKKSTFKSEETANSISANKHDEVIVLNSPQPAAKSENSPEKAEAQVMSKNIITNQNTISKKSDSEKLLASNKTISLNKPYVFKQTEIKENAVKNTSKKSGGDANTVLLVILSLFPILALIAIYIKDGKSITMNFWVDLLLHFIVLYWLFAILVVLDVFSLA